MKKLNLKKLNKLILIFIGLLFYWSCNTSEYHKLVKRELNKDVKFDSLIFNIKLGERKEDYFDKIWELNKKGIVFPAIGEYGTLRYMLKDKNSEIAMDFFPGFNKKNRLNKLKFMFSHPGWATWNIELYSNKLILKVLDSIKKWYPGNDFIVIKGDKIKKDVSDIYVKVDGNRQFKAYFMDNMKVIVDVENLNDK